MAGSVCTIVVVVVVVVVCFAFCEEVLAVMPG